jgi:inosine-uridine nucleoside N-ribohydrolase
MHDVLAAAVWAGLIGAHWRTARVRQLVPHGERQGMVCSDETAPTSVSYAARVDTGRFLELWRQMAADLD